VSKSAIQRLWAIYGGNIACFIRDSYLMVVETGCVTRLHEKRVINTQPRGLNGRQRRQVIDFTTAKQHVNELNECSSVYRYILV